MPTTEEKARALAAIGYNKPGLSIYEMYDVARYEGRIKDEQSIVEVNAAGQFYDALQRNQGRRTDYGPAQKEKVSYSKSGWTAVASAENGKVVWQHSSGAQVVQKEAPQYSPSVKTKVSQVSPIVPEYGFVPVSYADPTMQKENLEKRVSALDKDKAKLETEILTVERKRDSFNRAQEAVNRGVVIDSRDARALGFSDAERQNPDLAQQKLNVIYPGLSSSLIDVTEKAEGFQKSSSVVNKEIDSFNAALASGKFDEPIIKKTPLKSSGNFGVNLGLSLGESLFGSELDPGKYGTGGVVQRSSESFTGTVEFFGDIGAAAGGNVGRGIGKAIGIIPGGVSGLLEASVGTGIKTGGKTIERQTQSVFLGQAAETAGEVISLFVGGPKALASAGKVASKAPSALRFVSRLAGGEKSVYGTTAFFERGAVALEEFGAGAKMANFSGLYGPVTKAEKAGAIVAKVTSTSRTALKNPFVSTPVLTGFSLLAPSVAGEIKKAGASSEAKAFLSSPKGQEYLSDLFSSQAQAQARTGVRLPSFTFGSTGFGGTTGTIGGELGFGFFGSEKSELGGRPTAEVKAEAVRLAGAYGLSGTKATEVAQAGTGIYKATQAGGMAGQLSISTLTEMVGAKYIGGIVTKRLTGQIAGRAVKGTFKTGFSVAKSTVPAFAALGAYEGVVSTGVSKQTKRQSLGSQPFDYLIGGLSGGISAPLLGSPIIGFGVKRALKAGKSTVSKAGGTALLGIGYGLDPFEFPGDSMAKFLGSEEPSFKLVTSTRTGTSVSILQPANTTNAISSFVGIPSQINSSIKTPTSVSIFTPVNTPVTTPNLVPAISFNENITMPANNLFPGLSTPIPINDEVSQNVPSEVSTNIPTLITIPVFTPLARAGLPGFFPATPFGEGEGGGRGRSRSTFFNEFYFASALLGKNLARRAKVVAKERKNLFGFSRKRKRSRRKKK